MNLLDLSHLKPCGYQIYKYFEKSFNDLTKPFGFAYFIRLLFSYLNIFKFVSKFFFIFSLSGIHTKVIVKKSL